MNNADTTNKGIKPTVSSQPEIVKPAAQQPSAKMSEHKPDMKSVVAKTEPKLDIKTDIKVENKAAAKPESKPAAKTENKPVSKKSGNVVELSKKAHEAEEIVSGKAQQMQLRMMESSIENAEQLARNADAATRFFGETINIGRDQLEACAEAGNIAAECANKICEELVDFTNKSITENVEISKNFFSCRNAMDIMELNTRLTQNNIERLLSESSKLTDMWLTMTVKASEPISERMTDAADRLTKAMKK